MLAAHLDKGNSQQLLDFS